MYKTQETQQSPDGLPMTDDGLYICDATEDYIVLCKETQVGVPVTSVVSFRDLHKEVVIELPSYKVLKAEGVSEDIKSKSISILGEYERPILAFMGYWELSED